MLYFLVTKILTIEMWENYVCDGVGGREQVDVFIYTTYIKKKK